MKFIKAVEKKNDDCKRVFFQSSNKLNPTVDMLKHQEQLSILSSCEREKRTYKYEAISNMRHNYIIHYILAKKTVIIGRKVVSLKREQTREAFVITDTHMHPVFYMHTHTHTISLIYIM